MTGTVFAINIIVNTNILNNLKQFIHIEKGNKPDNCKFLPLRIKKSLYQKNAYSNKLNKTIIINTESAYALMVLPSHYRINYNLLKKVVFERSIKMNNLEDVQKIFPDYVQSPNITAINLIDLPVYIYFSTYSSDEKESVYDAGNFIDVMVTNYKH
jgi:hypothetical protein